MSRWGKTLTPGLSVPALAALVAGSIGAAPVKIQYLYHGSQEWWTTLAKAFEQENPDITIELTPGASLNKLSVLAAGDAVPDTFWIDMQDAQAVGALGITEDLDPWVKRDKSFGINEIIPQALDIYRYKGQLIGLPHGVFPNNYFFDANAFERAGLPLPSDLWQNDDWTWARFTEAARKLTQKGSDGKLKRLGASQGLLRGWIWSNGGALWDDIWQPTKSLINTPQAVDAMQFWQDLIWKDGSMWGGVNSLSGSTTSAFVNGQLAMEARWSTGIASYATANFKWGAVPYPKGPEGTYAADFATWGFGVSKTSAHKEAAWKWVAFITGKPGNLASPRLDGSVPARIRYTHNLDWLPQNMVNPDSVIALLEMGKVRLLGRTGVWNVVNPELDKLTKNQAPAASVAQNVERVADGWFAQDTH